jgi:hypothetical protein
VLGTPLTWIAMFAVMLFMISGGIYWIVGPTVVPDVEVIGTLQPGNAPTPPNPCQANDELKILMGAITVSSSAQNITALQIGNCKVLGMNRTADGISVSADLYDVSGNLIARIVNNNQTHVMTNERVKTSRSGDLTTLIVSSGLNEELLFVRYLNPNTIFARGIFNCPGHATVKIDVPLGASPNGLCIKNGITVN